MVHAENSVGEEGFPHVGDTEHVEGERHVEQDHGVGQIFVKAAQTHGALAQVMKSA